MSDLDPASLSSLYRWIDTIPLDRPKKNIARDFSDGVLMSQVIAYFFPKIVELHNYSSSNSIDQKNYNWKTLNRTNDDTTRTTRRRRRHTQHQHARSTFAHIEGVCYVCACVCVMFVEKVFKKMGFMISPVDIDAVVQCKRHAIERILLLIQSKIGEYQQTTANGHK